MWNSTARMGQIVKSITGHCDSANRNTLLHHNIISHSTITPQTISHFTAPPSDGIKCRAIIAKIGRHGKSKSEMAKRPIVPYHIKIHTLIRTYPTLELVWFDAVNTFLDALSVRVHV
jgi:hypothetical protein